VIKKENKQRFLEVTIEEVIATETTVQDSKGMQARKMSNLQTLRESNSKIPIILKPLKLKNLGL
jgi:hypothetical protein